MGRGNMRKGKGRGAYMIMSNMIVREAMLV
jgi:hypothetical protein